jgi:hypothetical protein
MPCYEPRTSENAVETERQMQLATRVACEAFEMLRSMGCDMRDLSSEAQSWWAAHKQFDASRMKGGVDFTPFK